MTRIALVGDYSESVVAHRAIPLALSAAGVQSGSTVSWDWLHSERIQAEPKSQLSAYNGIWCVPGSPYANAPGVLAAIRFAREQNRPFLGTCGGFQHALMEYARSLWDVTNPAHAEDEPDAPDPVISPLACALIDQTEFLQLAPGSRLMRIYGAERITEEYRCSFGLNPMYARRLEEGALRVCARDSSGGVRAVELEGHPFFIATLFQPERAALQGRTSPLVAAFVSAVVHAS
jgi:CTP synthase (UTP-ammonia lyase)